MVGGVVSAVLSLSSLLVSVSGVEVATWAKTGEIGPYIRDTARKTAKARDIDFVFNCGIFPL